MAPCGLVARGFGLRPSGRIVRTVRRGRPKGQPVVGIPPSAIRRGDHVGRPLWESRISFHKKGLSHDDKPFLSLKLKVQPLISTCGTPSGRPLRMQPTN